MCLHVSVLLAPLDERVLSGFMPEQRQVVADNRQWRRPRWEIPTFVVEVVEKHENNEDNKYLTNEEENHCSIANDTLSCGGVPRAAKRHSRNRWLPCRRGRAEIACSS